MAVEQGEMDSGERSTDPGTAESLRGITLLEGEEVVKNVLPSWSNWWKTLFLAVIFVLVGLVSVSGGNAGAMVIFFAVAGLLVTYVNYARKRSRYIVTNQRIKKRVGLARKSTGEARIRDIRGLSTDQGFFERLVGKGSVLIDTGTATGRLGIRGVPDHEGLARAIRQQQRRLEEEQ